MTAVTWYIIWGEVISLEQTRVNLMNDIREHVYSMSIFWCIYGALMDDAWTLGQGKLMLA